MQDESETLGIDGESVFFDPNDTWTKEDEDPTTPVPVHISTNQQPAFQSPTETSTGTGMPHVGQMELKPGVVNVTAAPKPVKPAKPTKPAWVSDTSIEDEKQAVKM